MWNFYKPFLVIFFHDKQQFLQFVKFGMVGSSGLIIDILTVYLLRHLIGLTLATLLAYFVASSSNWFINRLWTFNNINHRHSIIEQWIRFIMTNILGFCCNRGVVFSLFYISQFCKNNPFVPLIIGAATGMFANFHLSRKLVYKDKPI